MPIVGAVVVIGGALAAYYFFSQEPAPPAQTAQTTAAAGAVGATQSGQAPPTATAPPPATTLTTPPAPVLGPAPLPATGTQSAQAARSESSAQPASAGPPDPLVVRLIDAPLPPTAYEGWELSTPPFDAKSKNPDPGEVGQVMAHLDEKDRIGGITFKIFQTPAQARTALDETSTLPSDTPASVISTQRRFTTRRGAPVWCLAGQCTAAVGRVLIFVRLERSPFDATAAIVESLAVHVARFDK